MTAAQAFRLVEHEKGSQPQNPELAEILERFTGRDGKVTTRNIGNTIRGIKGNTFEGLAFEDTGELLRGLVCWRVVNKHQSNQREGCKFEKSEKANTAHYAGENDQDSDMMAHTSETCREREREESESSDFSDLRDDHPPLDAFGPAPPF